MSRYQTEKAFEIQLPSKIKYSQSISFIKIEKKDSDEPEHVPSLVFLNVPPKIPQDDSLIESLPSQKQKLSEEKNIDETNRISNDINKNRRSTIKSDFMRSLILSQESFFKKFFFFVKNICFCHIFAFILTIIKIVLQNYIHKYCWFDRCSCDNNLYIKIYSSFMDCLVCWSFYILINLKMILIFREFQFFTKKFFLDKVFFLFTFLGTFTYPILIEENEYNSIVIYFIVIIIPLCFWIFYLIYLKFMIKIWFTKLWKANILNCLVFFNYVIIRYLLPDLKDLIYDKCPEFWARNILEILSAFYFNLFFFGIKRFLFVYYKLVCGEIKNYECGISLIRFSIGFSFSVNISAVLKSEANYIGGWLLLFLYIHFVVKTYFNFDLLEEIWKKIKKSFLNKKDEAKIRDAEEVYFIKLYSGCLLDFQFIVLSRVFFWYFGKKWILSSFADVYLEDCGFEISDDFKITTFGFVSIVTINFLLIFMIFLYMIKMKKIILEFKMRNRYAYNIFFIFLMHSFFEGCVQVSSFIT